MSDETSDAPLSCGEAWIKYFVDKDLAGGYRRRDLSDMQIAFDAGWNAAIAAVKRELATPAPPC